MKLINFYALVATPDLLHFTINDHNDNYMSVLLRDLIVSKLVSK